MRRRKSSIHDSYHPPLQGFTFYPFLLPQVGKTQGGGSTLVFLLSFHGTHVSLQPGISHKKSTNNHQMRLELSGVLLSWTFPAAPKWILRKCHPYPFTVQHSRQKSRFCCQHAKRHGVANLCRYWDIFRKHGLGTRGAAYFGAPLQQEWVLRLQCGM